MSVVLQVRMRPDLMIDWVEKGDVRNRRQEIQSTCPSNDGVIPPSNITVG